MNNVSAGSTGTRPAPMLHIAIALGAVYVIWGSTYLAIRFAIETIPPFLMAATRYLTAGTLLYGWSRLRGAPRPTLIQWRSALILGAFLLLMGNGCVVWAEQHVDSGLAALLISTEPLWIVILVWLRTGRKRPDWRVMAGLGLGFVGLMLLVRPGSGSVNAAGAAALVLASLSWAWGSIYGQRAPLPASPLATTGMQMLSGGALLFLTAGAGLDLRLRQPRGRRPPRLVLRRRAADRQDPLRRGGHPHRRRPDQPRAVPALGVGPGSGAKGARRDGSGAGGGADGDRSRGVRGAVKSGRLP